MIVSLKQGSKDRYFKMKDDIKKLVPEGIVEEYLQRRITKVFTTSRGLRAGMGYCGSKDVETLKETGRFERITASGINESHPHDVSITRKHQIIQDNLFKYFFKGHIIMSLFLLN